MDRSNLCHRRRTGEGLAGIRDKLRNAGKWYNDYKDRRAHAFCVSTSPSVMVDNNQPVDGGKTRGIMPRRTLRSAWRKPLKSHFNDPNYPANGGSLIVSSI
jgi:hypothetical protein